MADTPGSEPAELTAGLPTLIGLGQDELRTLSYAAAIGREFDFQLLVAAIGGDEETLAEQLESLVHRQILRERVGGDRFAFVHEELRVSLYRSLTASRLRVLHRKIAEAIERRYPDPPAEIIPELGRHFFLGKVPEKSYQYNLAAANIATADDDPAVAAHHLERARIDLGALPGDHRREVAELAERLGDLHFGMGDVRSADRLYAEALQNTGLEPALTARLTLGRAEVAREDLRSDDAIAGAETARGIFRDIGDTVGLAKVHRVLGRVEFNRGAYREALDESMSALEILENAGQPKLLGRICIDIGNSFAMLGPDVREDAVEWYQRAIDRLTEAADWTEVARGYHNLGIAVGETRPVDGLEYLAKSREYAERGHELKAAGWALMTGVEMRLALGQVDEAQRDNEQAARMFERLDDPLGTQLTSINRGLICERRAQWEDAERSYRLALQSAEKNHLNPEVAECQFHLARLLFKTRNLAGAREAYQAAVHLDLPQLKPSLAPRFHELGRQLGAAREETSPMPTPETPSSP